MSSSGPRSGDEPEDVLNRLANAIGIAVYDKRNRSLTELDRQLSRRCAGTNADIADDAVHVHSGVAKRCLSGLHAVEIKHLADQRVDFLCRTEDFIGTSLDLALGQATVAYQLAKALYSDECGAGFVPHHRSKRRDDLVEAFERNQVFDRRFGVQSVSYRGLACQAMCPIGRKSILDRVVISFGASGVGALSQPARFGLPRRLYPGAGGCET